LGAAGGYLLSTLTDIGKSALKSATGAAKKLVTGPINNAISSVKRGPAPKMPEAVEKSAAPEKFNPVTGEATSSREGRGHYGPEKVYGDKPAYGTYAALMVPLFIGAAWLAYIFLLGKSDIGAGQLSPFSIRKQAFLLVIFMVVYLIFVILLYAGKEKAKKNIKKVERQRRKKR
jgi:hypothetical protein